jgi:predicted transposase YdaD
MKSIMELFKGDAVKFFGIDVKVVSATRTELSHINIQKNIDDWVLLTEDDSFIHLEFQTTYSTDDLARFMVSDAMLYYKERKPIKTIVVYSSDITDTITTLDTEAIQYQVNAFYMTRLDGDRTYSDIKAKIEAGIKPTKQDLMSIVFLPLMKNSVDKITRIEQAIGLSKELKDHDEQLQIQAMLDLLAEKFIRDKEILSRIKEMLNMGAIAEMIKRDDMIDVAKKALIEGASIEFVMKITDLDVETVSQLQDELNND